jgi:hypothetical protein
LTGDYSYESSKYAQEHNLIETGDQSLVGARTGFDTGRWDVSLWVRNLLDDDTPVDIQRYIDGSEGPAGLLDTSMENAGSNLPRGFAVALPRGRQVGASFRLRF